MSDHGKQPEKVIRQPPRGDDRFATTDRPVVTFHEYTRIEKERLSSSLNNLLHTGKEEMDIINPPAMVTNPDHQLFAGAVPDQVATNVSDLLPQYMTKVNSHLAGELKNDGTPVQVPNPEQLGDICAVWDRIKTLAQNNSPGLLKKESIGLHVGIMLQFLYGLLLANYGPGNPWAGVNYKYNKSWIVRSTKHGQTVYFDPFGNAVIMPGTNDKKFTQTPFAHLHLDQRFPAQCVGINNRGFGSLFGGSGGGAISSSASSSNLVPPMGQMQALPPGQVSPPAQILAGTFASINSISAIIPRHAAGVAQQFLSSHDPDQNWVETHWPANANSTNSGPPSSGIGGPDVFNGE